METLTEMRMDNQNLPERDDFLGKNSSRSAANGRKEEPRPQRKREEDLGDSL